MTRRTYRYSQHIDQLIGRRAIEPKAVGARTVFETAGYEVEEIDELHWRVRGFEFWPATGLWTYPEGVEGPNGQTQGNGAGRLLAALKAVT